MLKDDIETKGFLWSAGVFFPLNSFILCGFYMDAQQNRLIPHVQPSPIITFSPTSLPSPLFFSPSPLHHSLIGWFHHLPAESADLSTQDKCL